MAEHKIASTAETIAFLRGRNLSWSDPLDSFRIRLAEACDAEAKTRAFYHRPDFDVDLSRMAKMVPWALLRLYALEEALAQSNVLNILELGSGFSSLGLDMVHADSRIRYLETDLPEVIERKKEVALKIQPTLSEQLEYEALDVFGRDQMYGLANRFFPGPFAVVNEGLLLYFTHEEKLAVALNVADALSKLGGVWVTTDIALRKNLEQAFNTDEYTRRLREVMKENTGRNMVELAFNSYDEAEQLFMDAGFSITRHRQLDFVPHFGFLADKHKNLAYQQLWIMRLTRRGRT